MNFISKSNLNIGILIGLLFLLLKTIQEAATYIKSDNEYFLDETPRLPYYGSALIFSVFLAFSYFGYQQDLEFSFDIRSLIAIGFILSIIYALGYVIIRSQKHKNIKQNLLSKIYTPEYKGGKSDLYGLLILFSVIGGCYLLFILAQYLFIGDVVW